MNHQKQYNHWYKRIPNLLVVNSCLFTTRNSMFFGFYVAREMVCFLSFFISINVCVKGSSRLWRWSWERETPPVSRQISPPLSPSPTTQSTPRWGKLYYLSISCSFLFSLAHRFLLSAIFHFLTQTTVQVDLPDSTMVDSGSSSCGSDGRPVSLVGVFGPGHTLGLFFSNNGSMYSVDMLSLQYNLSDSSLFPLANSSGQKHHIISNNILNLWSLSFWLTPSKRTWGYL